MALPCFAEEDPGEIRKSAESWVNAFNSKDAAAISDLFVPEGEIVLSSGEIIAGKKEIQKHYELIFEEAEKLQVAIEVSSLRFVTKELAVEDGTVHSTAADGEISSTHYLAIHAKQEDGSWLLASVRDQEGDHALPEEKLLGLEWLIGDWLIQTKSSETWISFFWSGEGPYIDAKAVTETPTGPSTAATLRIGWDERDESYRSWGFDAEGGYTQSTWTERREDEWLLRTAGVTATGDKNEAIQIIARDASKTKFTWSKRDQIIGGIAQPERSLTVVKRPPPVATSSEAE